MTNAFTERALLPERMDDPRCSEALLLRTVRQFASINRLVSRHRAILKRWMLADMAREPGRGYHLVDLGAGGCDIDVWLLDAARRQGVDLRITACEADARIAAYARDAHAGVQGLAIREMDVLRAAPEEPVDYVFANHFLHHLTDRQIPELLAGWAPRVRRAMVFSDLRRHWAAYAGFSVLSLFYRNSYAREDGLISVRKGFTASELRAFAEAAGVLAAVHRLTPGRLVLVAAA